MGGSGKRLTNPAVGRVGAGSDVEEAAILDGRGGFVHAKGTSSTKHWDCAAGLLGARLPTLDDVSTTLSGEPLDTADKVRDFLAAFNADRTL